MYLFIEFILLYVIKRAKMLDDFKILISTYFYPIFYRGRRLMFSRKSLEIRQLRKQVISNIS